MTTFLSFNYQARRRIEEQGWERQAHGVYGPRTRCRAYHVKPTTSSLFTRQAWWAYNSWEPLSLFLSLIPYLFINKLKGGMCDVIDDWGMELKLVCFTIPYEWGEKNVPKALGKFMPCCQTFSIMVF